MGCTIWKTRSIVKCTIGWQNQRSHASPCLPMDGPMLRLRHIAWKVPHINLYNYWLRSRQNTWLNCLPEDTELRLPYVEEYIKLLQEIADGSLSYSDVQDQQTSEEEHYARILLEGVMVKWENHALKETIISPELSMNLSCSITAWPGGTKSYVYPLDNGSWLDSIKCTATHGQHRTFSNLDISDINGHLQAGRDSVLTAHMPHSFTLPIIHFDSCNQFHVHMYISHWGPGEQSPSLEIIFNS